MRSTNVPKPDLSAVSERTIVVDGVRTFFLEAGTGAPLVLLHSGEFGADSSLSWEYNISTLSKYYRVVAPDWLGFGKTDKIHDFENKQRRMVLHMRRFLEVMGIVSAPMVGNSMAGQILLRSASSVLPALQSSKIVSISGGGFVPLSREREILTGYDGSFEWMRGIVEALFFDPKWPQDEEYVERRHANSLLAGAWEAVAASRFRRPGNGSSEYGGVDSTPYEDIEVPVLLISGEDDKLKVSGWAQELARRIPDGTALDFQNSKHCSHIEHPSGVNDAILDFIS